MTSAGILLRVLLGLALIFNAVSASLASGDMAGAARTTADAVGAASAAAVHATCHEAVAVGAHTGQGESPQAPQSPAEDDCCGNGLCGCACAQLPSLAAFHSVFLPPPIEHEASAEKLGGPRPAPSLGHLIRPPIV